MWHCIPLVSAQARQKQVHLCKFQSAGATKLDPVLFRKLRQENEFLGNLSYITRLGQKSLLYNYIIQAWWVMPITVLRRLSEAKLLRLWLV